MTAEQSHDAHETGETHAWAWPVDAFVAWLATLLGYVTRFKRIRRSHRFKPDWRDSWADLRHSEWLRDQLIAQGVAQLPAGQALQLDDTKIQLTPPTTYGGPCPRTPFDMNRRFIALACWAADPEAIIRERFKRISRDALVAQGSTYAPCAAHYEAVGVCWPYEAPVDMARRSAAQAAARGRAHLGPRPARFPLLLTADCLGSASFRDGPRVPS